VLLTVITVPIEVLPVTSSGFIRDFRIQPRCKRDLPSSGILRILER